MALGLGREHRRRPRRAPSGPRRGCTRRRRRRDGRPDADLARRAWRAMSDVVLDHDRKLAVSQALGLSWARVRALRRAGRAAAHAARARRAAGGRPALRHADRRRPRGARARAADAASRGPAGEARRADRGRPRRRRARRGDPGRAAGRRCATCPPRISRPCCECSSAWPPSGPPPLERRPRDRRQHVRPPAAGAKAAVSPRPGRSRSIRSAETAPSRAGVSESVPPTATLTSRKKSWSNTQGLPPRSPGVTVP